MPQRMLALRHLRVAVLAVALAAAGWAALGDGVVSPDVAADKGMYGIIT